MPDDSSPTADERAAMRAFLQRCEVRLSTMHRVATALLSGAGILVLLPAVERDAVVQVLRALLVGPVRWSRGLLAVAVVLSIFLSLAVLWLLIIELTRFYFHSNHVIEGDREVFTPRFTLTGLRIPGDELGPATRAAYNGVHSSDASVRLLVPGNERARARIDQQLGVYPGLVDPDVEPDLARAQAMFRLAASASRPMVEEVSKIEHGMVRHMLRLQVIVLRYVKALLVIVVTALAAFAASAAVNGHDVISPADERWIAGTMLIWAPVVLIVVSSPRWCCWWCGTRCPARGGWGLGQRSPCRRRWWPWRSCSAIPAVPVLRGSEGHRPSGRIWLRFTTFIASCDVSVCTNGRPARRSM